MTNERTELKQLWVEKYRPSKMEDYVWIDQNQKKMIELRKILIFSYTYTTVMDEAVAKERVIVLDQHIIEGWGLWWVQWQKDTKDRLRKSVNRTRVNHFSDLHLVGPKSNNLLANTTTSPLVPLVLLTK